MKGIFFILCFMLLMSGFAYSLESDYLLNYFTMGDGTGKTMYDTHLQQVLLKSLYNWIVFNGTEQNALYSTGYLGNAYPMYGTKVTENSTPFSPGNWTVNVWLYQDSNKGTYPRVCVPYDVYCVAMMSNATGFKNIQMVRSGSFSSTYQTWMKDMNNSIGFDEWFMLTITYNGSIGKAYINGELMTNFSSYITPNSDYLAIYGYEGAIDELSIWNKTLNYSEMMQLYDNGTGLNYLETMSNATLNYTPDIEVSYAFYYDYCIDDRLCNVFQTNISQCIDEYSINCIYGCEQYDLGFGGYYYGSCINDSQILTYTSTNFYDICLPGNVLCHNATINNGSITCPYTINTVLNRISCTAGCTDRQYNYTLPGQYPSENNYSGFCAICVNECHALQDTRCNGMIVQSCNELMNGCYYWKDILQCVYSCSNGNCLTYSEYLQQNPQNETTYTNYSGFIINGEISDNNKVFVLIVLMIIVFAVPVAIGYTTGMTPLGFIFGIFMTCTLLVLASIDSFPLIGGFIPNWVVILLAFIGAGLCAMFIRDWVMLTQGG